jgi:uncharacterized protein
MNISKTEQRVLHVLAQGGAIRHEQGHGKVFEALCLTRDGMILTDCTLPLFQRLRRRGLIESKDGVPYRISALGRKVVRAQTDNR